MKKPVIPESFKHLPDSTLIRYRDLADMFGVSQQSITEYVKKGKLPAHTVSHKDIRAVAKQRYGAETPKVLSNSRAKYWRLGDIRKLAEAPND